MQSTDGQGVYVVVGLPDHWRKPIVVLTAARDEPGGAHSLRPNINFVLAFPSIEEATKAKGEIQAPEHVLEVVPMHVAHFLLENSDRLHRVRTLIRQPFEQPAGLPGRFLDVRGLLEKEPGAMFGLPAEKD